MRFLFPILPLFNLAAAVALVRASRNRRKSTLQRVVWLATVALVLAGLAASAFMLFISAHNYPGGQALYQLHQHVAPGGAWRTTSSSHANDGDQVSVHIDVLPAMTGVSRFLELGPPWSYSKVRGQHTTPAAQPSSVGKMDVNLTDVRSCCHSAAPIAHGSGVLVSPVLASDA